MPMFRLNPIFPGDVIMLKNETEYVSHKACYPKVPVGKYKAIQAYKSDDSIGLAGDIKIGGELLHKEIASIEAGGAATFESTGAIIVSPLSIDGVDLATLSHANSANPDCRIIQDLLSGKARGTALTQQVLHGRVNILLTTKPEGSLDAQAKGELLKKIAGTFKIREAEISVSGNKASFAVAESPDPMTLAIVPSGFNYEELARITNYLQGDRGAQLEIAVREAVKAGDVSEYEKWKLRIQELLGNDELKNKERWAENMVGATPVEKVREAPRDTIDLQKVATYGAAMETVRQEAPARNR